MSRQIDITKPLSDEDVAYLDSRARHDLIEQNARMMAAESESGPATIDGGNTGDIDPFKADDGTDLLAGTNPGETPLTAIQAVEVQQRSDEGLAASDEDGEELEPTRQTGDALEADEEDDGDDEFSGLTNDELRDALESRDLPKSGNKKEMLARLRNHESDNE